MTTMELICELRDQAQVFEPGTLYHLLNEAADAIETLDERVSILNAEMVVLDGGKVDIVKG